MKALRRSAALIVIISLTLSLASAAVYGTQQYQSGIIINNGATLASGVFFSTEDSAHQSESYIEYSPGGSVVPVVAYGKQLYGRSSLNYVADYLEDNDFTVVAGINADFFELSSGISQGIVITDGNIKASDNSKYAIGFYEDGTAIIGKPNIEIVATIGGAEFIGLHINKELTESMGFGLYTRDYAETTETSIPSINVIIETDSIDFQIGGVVAGRVTAVTSSSGKLTIPSGCVVMSIASNSSYATALEAVGRVSVGDSVSITVGGSSDWRNIKYAVGGGSILVEDSSVQTQDSSSVSKDITARSAVGVKRDGTIVFYTVDGKQDKLSKGITLSELADRMEELGCVTALNLDGGGSTTIAVKFPGDESITTVNSPSDGEQRKCANFIFLVNTARPTGAAANLVVYPYSAVVLKGSTIPYDVIAVDSGWYSCELPSTGVGYSSDLGVFSDGGAFKAEETGLGSIYATLDRLEGSTSVTVIDNPSSISILYEELEYDITGRTIGVAPETQLNLLAKVSVEDFNIDIRSSNSAFSWQISGDIGTVDENGLFTAASTESDVSGKITVSYGDKSAELSVTVSSSSVEGWAIEGFEAGSTLPVSDSEALSVSRETNIDNVRYGKSSLKLSYDFSSATSLTASVYQPISSGITHLGLWVKGDDSDNMLALNIGQSVLEVCTLDFSDWKFFSVKLGDDTASLNGYSILAGDDTAVQGSVLIDQLIEAKGPIYDVTPPVITASIVTDEDDSGKQLAATITDNGAAVMKSEYIMLTYDGKPLSFTFDKNKLTADLPENDDNSHLVSILASDSCGNLSRASVEIAGTGEVNPFSDMNGHWAASFTSYMYRMGVVSGMTQDGNTVYKPDNEMTRAQFAVIIANWLGLDLEAYSNVELPFADNADIPNWALSAIKSVYSLGIVKGNSSGGVLKYNPDSSLTRAEAMTIIGRTQAKGFAEASLSDFNDADSVQDWAANYIKTLIAQGVVSGSNGRINPSAPVTRAQVAKMLYTLM